MSYSGNEPDNNANTRQGSAAAHRTNAQFIQRRTPQATSQSRDNSSSSAATLIPSTEQSSRQQSPNTTEPAPKLVSKRSDSIDLAQLDAYALREPPLGTAAAMAGQDTYTGLGQYPSKYRKFAGKSWLRLAGVFIGICVLGYFGIGAFRSSSLGSSKSTDAAAAADPRLQSMYCDIPHPGRPLLQYVLMVDAGSTGSRIHVYKFNYCKNHPMLEDEIFQQIKPGLSS
ncbi:Guanosine-diphosphatase, partial [Coemansia sp. RSA 2052]